MSDPTEPESHQSRTRVPTYTDLLWPTLQVLKTRGGSASIRELEDDIAASLRLSEEILEVPHGDGPQSEVNYRSAWARTHLKSGFTKVEVTGRSGDGGIDGAGVLRVNLLSFHVWFQCKRYSGSVGAREVRDFRGAMVGRADKGLFITTGRFTGDAEREAVRDGAPAIDLIDGMDLCDLLKDLRLGIATETVEVAEVNASFFAGV